MASTMARTSCSEALTSGRSGRTPGVSDEVLMQFLRPRIYRSTSAGERQQEAPQQNSLWGLVFTQSGRRDLATPQGGPAPVARAHPDTIVMTLVPLTALVAIVMAALRRHYLVPGATWSRSAA